MIASAFQRQKGAISPKNILFIRQRTTDEVLHYYV